MSADFNIAYTATAAKQIRKLDRSAQVRVLKTVEILGATPRPPKATQLVGGDGQWRIRVGDYRIVYEIHDHELLILVVKVGHRKEIYRHQKALRKSAPAVPGAPGL
ncbi:type II toxin-antitoxin system RelE family toxin [Paenarthrobacter sp. 2TAF44]|uniref:type II toxin-antitoxin system RelE family toxin n=1 Tax=Paenarthrobacter sp. 2TAF44 TaxID=3233018 RepID=UPI003F9E50DC